MKPPSLPAIAALALCLFPAEPAQASPGASKTLPAALAKKAAPVSAAKRTVPVSDADLRAMARKIIRARHPAALRKSAPMGVSALPAAVNRPGIPGAGLFPYATPSSRSLRIEWSRAGGTPILLEGASLGNPLPGDPAKPGPPGTRALAWFQANRDLMRLRDPASELRFADASFDRLGGRHEVFQQVYRNVPVWGGTVNAHFNRAGAFYSVNARYSPTTAMPSGPDYRLTADEAMNLASVDAARHSPLQDFSPATRALLAYPGPLVERNVWVHPSGKHAHWAWRVEIRPNIRDRWRYFIDGVTGAILEKYNATNSDGPTTAAAADLLEKERTINTYQVGAVYYLIDGSRKAFDPKSSLPNDPKGALMTLDAGNTDLARLSQVTSRTNTWTDPTAVSAHFNMGRVFDYYLGTFGRAGIDGAGSTILSIVHVTQGGAKMDDAFWNGIAMAYGDGNQSLLPTARALDVAAHEMTHGVIDATVKLEYKFQSGALNESLADIFGAMVDRDDWTLGEDVVNPAVFRSGAMRNLENPHNGGTGPSQPGWQPAHMDEFLELPIEDDNGGVHSNSGIPNRACYLIAEAIGREKAEKIYYRVMEARYLNPGSQFIDMRIGAVRAAADLYGETSPEVAAVRDGFAKVGIGSSASPDTPTPRPPDAPPVAGIEFVAMVKAAPDDNTLYAANPVVNADSDIVQITRTQVYTGTGNPIAITDDGSVLLFIDADNAIRVVDDQGEQVVSDLGTWKSIAVSPDGSKVAATTLGPDAKIHILDLVNPDDSKAVPLYNPTTGIDARAGNVVFADAMDFNSTGEYLLYDAFNRVPQAEGDPIEYYDANLLDIKRGVITPFLPARPDGIHMANPSFAQTSDLRIAFDMYDEATGTWRVVTGDMFAGEYAVIDSVGASAGYPRYSTRDDRIVFERAEADGTDLYQIPLSGDNHTAAGPARFYVAEAQKPVWFAIGKRPAGIRLPRSARHERYSLRAGPGDGVLLELPASAEVVVSAFDMAGRNRGELLRGRRAAGTYRLAWPPGPRAGLYILRLEARPDAGPKVALSRKFALPGP